MQKYRCYGKDDLGYPYDALYERDDNGDWYDAAEVDARIAELEKALSYYADPKKWREFRVTEGDIFGSREDDLALAFNAEDDSPWNVAANVL